MERFTQRSTQPDKHWCVPLVGLIEAGKVPSDGQYVPGCVIDRLADYEDAEEDGRLAVLPCKIGDTVYYITGKIKEAKILGFSYYKDKGWEMILHGNSFIAAWCTSSKLSDFGKTVFLSREEADVALAAMEEESE